ncbi:MAG: SRPBCC family protein [Pyrinomonadaceae bacterium]
MPSIHLETFIRAPAARCFNVARNIDAHVAAASVFKHRAVGGVTTGLISLGEEVTWEARIFGVRQRLTSRIVEMEEPRRFVDEMQRGAFARWRHTHTFEPRAGGTLMTDAVSFASPLGLLGAMVDALFLKKYMTRFLLGHNAALKETAERASHDEAASNSSLNTDDGRT